LKIGEQEIGPGYPPYVIAEIGVNHDGEVSRALELTDAAADAGADAVKLQLFETDRLMSMAAKLAAYQKNAGETDPLAMLRRLELSIEEMAQVVDRAHKRGIHAIVTVFSVELVEVAERLPWDAYKSASPDIINKPLLEAMAATGKPLIVSTGASELDEVTQAAGWLEGIRDRLAFLQCVSCYPAPEGAFGGIVAISEATGLPVGYSDHLEGWDAAVHLPEWGCCLFEKHITYDREAVGPDHAASFEPNVLRKYVHYAHSRDEVSGDELIPNFRVPQILRVEFERDWGEASHFKDQLVGKLEKAVLDCERDVRHVSRQSLVTTCPLVSGMTITRDDLTIKRPGTGLPPYMLEELIGRTLARDVEMDVPLANEDLA
jgi:N,N'-diacetyllegionaminate synthase